MQTSSCSSAGGMVFPDERAHKVVYTENHPARFEEVRRRIFASSREATAGPTRYLVQCLRHLFSYRQTRWPSRTPLVSWSSWRPSRFLYLHTTRSSFNIFIPSCSATATLLDRCRIQPKNLQTKLVLCHFTFLHTFQCQPRLPLL